MLGLYPNIIGTFYTPKWIGFTGWGAVTSWVATGSNKDSADQSGAKNQGIEFRASLSSEIYSGSTVQPAALQALTIIKI